MKKSLILCWVILLAGTMAFAQYRPDILGQGFEARTFDMPADYNGKVVATLVRRMQPETDRAVLYVHGYNDYFFQSQMADSLNSWGLNFYAVDLRKYGRSLLPGQTPFEVYELEEYFADIDSALVTMREEGNREIILMAHSTGGLITSLYCQAHRSDLPVNALILNSPFLDMNLSPFMEAVLVPMVSAWGSLVKGTKINQGLSSAYAESLLDSSHGEWTFNTDWKIPVSPAVTSAWIRAIHRGHVEVQRGMEIPCPILLMYSARSVYGEEWTPDHQRGDAVLDVKDIAEYGRTLGADVTEYEVMDGLHDLVLSQKPARDSVYAEMYRWLKEKGLL